MISLSLTKPLVSSLYRSLSSAAVLTKNLPFKYHNNNHIKCFHSSRPLNDLKEFFDDESNWGLTTVKTGRAWKIDELRIKSNGDLHKLWFVLYKERNMLLTMKEAADDNDEVFASPERIDKVEESMKLLENVVRERNKAYWELEIGEGKSGERQTVFRRDIFGQWKWMGCNEHLIPYFMNAKWRNLNSPGSGSDVLDFCKKMREKKMVNKWVKINREEKYCRQLLWRFPDLDAEYLQEKFPNVNVARTKENLFELLRKNRQNNRRGRLRSGR